MKTGVESLMLIFLSKPFLRGCVFYYFLQPAEHGPPRLQPGQGSPVRFPKSSGRGPRPAGRQQALGCPHRVRSPGMGGEVTLFHFKNMCPWCRCGTQVFSTRPGRVASSCWRTRWWRSPSSTTWSPGQAQDSGNDGSNHHQGCRDLQRSSGSGLCTHSEAFSQSHLDEDIQNICDDSIRICCKSCPPNMLHLSRRSVYYLFDVQ